MGRGERIGRDGNGTECGNGERGGKKEGEASKGHFLVFCLHSLI